MKINENKPDSVSLGARGVVAMAQHSHKPLTQRIDGAHGALGMFAERERHAVLFSQHGRHNGVGGRLPRQH